MRTLVIVSFGLAVFAGAAAAQPGPRGGDDGDGFITRQEFDARREALFNRLDANNDAYLAGSELTQPRERRRHAWRRHVDARLDANSDGAITREEFLERPLRAFAILDRDGDGVISASERAEARTRRDTRIEERLEFRRERADANHDGRVSREEFRRLGDERFQRADVNRDGRLSAEEAARVAHERR